MVQDITPTILSLLLVVLFVKSSITVRDLNKPPNVFLMH